MFRRFRKSGTASKIGCGYIFWIGLIICVLLVINVQIVKLFFRSNFPDVDFRISQAAHSVLPVVMIFFEFWVFDIFFSRAELPQDEEMELE